MNLVPLSKLSRSSTFWVAIMLPALQVLAARNGVEVPWDVVLAGIASYGVKEAAGKLPASRAPIDAPLTQSQS